MNMKFRIESPEHSEAIHQELKRLGVIWDQIDLKYRFIYVMNNELSYGIVPTFYELNDATETTLEQLKLM